MLRMLKLLDDSELVKKLELIRYINEEGLLYIYARAVFIDGSVLYLREKLSLKGRRYSYHWVDSNGNLIARWDNAPHHRNIKTYPHHIHLPDGSVKESTENEGLKIAEYILKNVKK